MYTIKNQNKSDDETLLVSFLVLKGIISNTSDARRMICQNAVKLNNELVTDINLKINPKSQLIIQTGKRGLYVQAENND